MKLQNLYTVNFDKLDGNADVVCNRKKHELKNVDPIKYEESLSEVRKFLLAYVDGKAKLNILDTKGAYDIFQMGRILEYTDNFNPNGVWSYVLVIDSVAGIPSEQRKALTYIPWALVIDLDPDSDNNGLSRAYFDQHGVQPKRFKQRKPEKTEFNVYSKQPYWFFANGQTEISASVAVDSFKDWKRKYGSNLYTLFSKYHKCFEKKVRVVILTHDTERMEKIAEAFDMAYDEAVEFLLFSGPMPNILDGYKSTLFPIETDSFARGLLSHASIFDIDSQNRDIFMPSGNEGAMTAVLAANYDHFELVHQHIGDTALASEDDKNPILYYQGKNKLSWYGAKQDFSVQRNSVSKYLKTKISKLDDSHGIIEISHTPGIGGTTAVRDFAYSIRMEHPVCILRKYERDITATQLKNLYNELRAQIIVIVDSAVLAKDQVESLYREILPDAFPFVIIFAKRRAVSDDSIIPYLNDHEFDEMMQKLSPYCTSKITQRLQKIKKSTVQTYERSPFFMSLYTFEKDFVGIKPFICRFLAEMAEEQKKLLTYLALADFYADKPISEAFFSHTLVSTTNQDDTTSPRTVFDDLVVLESTINTRCYRIRHPLFAEEIIEQVLYHDSNGNSLSSDESAERLTDALCGFIKYSRENITVEYDTVLDVLKNLLIIRDRDALNKERFAPMIEKIRKLSISEPAGNIRAGRVFTELVEAYPDNAHFLAHLSRYYTYVDKNYEKGIQLADDAISILEQENEEIVDPILYHIYAMAIKVQIKNKLCKEVKEAHSHGDSVLEQNLIDRIISDTDCALENFDTSRIAANPDAGYQAAIDLCIIILDTAKMISEYADDETHKFVSSDPNAWYMKYLDIADEMMETWKTGDKEAKQGLTSDMMRYSGADDLTNLNATINLWKSALTSADEKNGVQIRRLLARAQSWRLNLSTYKATQTDYEDIVHLMEQNIDYEPQNGANIRIWFDAIRNYKSENPDLLLDNVLGKLSMWKSSGSLEAYYYYFICTCIKAIEGSSRAESEVAHLAVELKAKSEKRYDSRNVYEWLGTGKGLSRLIKQRGKKLIPNEINLQKMNGYITNFKNPGNAVITSHSIEVFFNPKQSKQIFSKDSEGSQVSFCMGFSYDGARAYNQSVERVSTKEEYVSSGKIQVGIRIRCKVVKNTELYTQVKFLDYSNVLGRIHISKLGKNYSETDRPEINDILYAKIINNQVNGFWILSLD